MIVGERRMCARDRRSIGAIWARFPRAGSGAQAVGGTTTCAAMGAVIDTEVIDLNDDGHE